MDVELGYQSNIQVLLDRENALKTFQGLRKKDSFWKEG